MTTTISDPEVECLKLKKQINENHRLAQKAAGDAVERAILTGELLQQWKDLLPHGKFEPFVEKHFDGSLRTAQKYMQAAKRLNALPKAHRTALLKDDLSITELLEFPKSTSVAAGREARTSEGTPVAPEGGSNPPATSSNGSGDGHRPPRSGKERDSAPVDYGKCPNCAGAKWVKDDFGLTVCAKCAHPHGEPTGDVDEDRVDIQRSKTVKTAEALLRAFDDLNMLLAKSDEHTEAIASCKFLLKTARNWK